MTQFVSAVIALVAALASAALVYLAKTQRLRIESSTLNRKAWMNTVIDLLTEFLTVLKHGTEDSSRVTQLSLRLELMLNPTAEDHDDIKKAKIDLCRILSGPRNTRTITDDQEHRIVERAREILAFEWGRVRQLK